LRRARRDAVRHRRGFFESVEQAPVKKHPSGRTVGCGAAGNSDFDGASSEGDLIHPRQRRAFVEHLFLDDPSARLLHRGMAASAEFNQQR
jgi:hypothetical protein